MSEELPRPATGFVVRAELRMTPDKGIGVFAAEFIPANTRVNDYHDITYYNEEEAIAYLASLPSDEERKWWLEHGYGVNNKIAVVNDDSQMVNHSHNPTLVENPDDGHDYTTRDVYEGEELTEDYRTYDFVPFFEDLCEEYGILDLYMDDD